MTYSDKKSWPRYVKEYEDDSPVLPSSGLKRKTGKVGASESAMVVDGAGSAPEYAKDRGRTAKIRFDDTDAPENKRKDQISKGNEDDEYYDYVYEYEYDYDDEAKEREMKKEETAIKQKGRSPTRLKSEPMKDEYAPDVVQKILGQRGCIGESEVPPVYLTKFMNRPYVQSRWLDRSAVTKCEDGESVLKQFLTRTAKGTLFHSLSVPSLLVEDGHDVDGLSFEVERILHESVDSQGNREYLCKWHLVDYDGATLESEVSLSSTDESCLNRWNEWKQRRNSKTIPQRWVHPPPEDYTPITVQPVSKSGEVMKDFQLEGFNWLRECWYKRKFTVLADETRTGKITQCVAMLAYLSEKYRVNGPFLVLTAPEHVDRWKTAFNEWSDLNVVAFIGSTGSRQMIFDSEFDCLDGHGRASKDVIRVDVVLTTYEIFLASHKQYFEGIEWRYIMADDGSKMMNSRGRVRALLMQSAHFEHATLLMEWARDKLSGTQGNVIKMFCLLNFLDRDNYNNITDFLARYGGRESDSASLNSDLLTVVDTYLLARDKKMIDDVMLPKEEMYLLCEPSDIQRRLYKDAIKQKTEILMRKITDEADAPLISLIQTLRRLCNHPFLMDETKYDIGSVLDDSSVLMSCGKMMALDKLVPMYMSEGKRIVIFSQMVRVLDVLELYLKSVDIEFQRIDASVPVCKRNAIANDLDTGKCKVLLMSSKPGSFRLPTGAADVIIVYDSDSFSFIKETTASIIRLVTKGSFEEMISDGSLRTDSDAGDLCFDESVIGFCEGNGPSLIDAQDVELILRGSVKEMFTDSDEKWEEFCQVSSLDLLEKYRRQTATVKGTEINIKRQNDFWNTLLEPPRKPKGGNVNSGEMEIELIKKLSQRLNDFGFKGQEDESDLLKCALTFAPPEDSKAVSALQRIVGDNSSDAPVERFGQSYYMVEKLAKKFFASVLFFDRLPKALYCATLPELVWPSIKPVWGDAGSDYFLLYTVAMNGYRNIVAALDNEEHESAKNLTKSQVENRATSLVRRILDQFPDIEVPDGFTPVPPNEWKCQ